MVDSTDLANNDDGDALRQTAEYLHDVLLLLQKQVEKSSSSKSGLRMRVRTQQQQGERRGGEEREDLVNVLVAANKADLFTALPAPLVRKTLEREIGFVRESLRQGLLGSGVDEVAAEEKGWLGEVGGGTEGEEGFRFEQLEEVGVAVSVRGGSVFEGGEGEGEKEKGDVREWWAWVGECL